MSQGTTNEPDSNNARTDALGESAIPKYAVSGSAFREMPFEQWPPPNREDMPALVMYWQSMKAMYHALRTRMGPFRSFWLLVASMMPLRRSDKPKWHPEHFNLRSKTEEETFLKIFGEFKMLITLFNKLKRIYGEDLADKLTGKMAIPMAVPFLRQAFHPVEDLNSVDPVLQQLSNYLAETIGEDKAFMGRYFVSEDHTEARLLVTKCAYMQVLIDYGLKSFAAKSCLADHVIFDTVLPNMAFSRKHTIGVGDPFCDHAFRVPIPADSERDPAWYEDCRNVPDGMEEVSRWSEVFRERFRKPS